LKKLLIVTLFITVALVYMKSINESIVIIPENSLRFRLIANSPSLEDTVIKNEVKVKIEKDIATLLKESNSINESRKILSNNLNIIEDKVEDALKDYNLDFEVNFGENYFPRKEYKGVVYEEGLYESLVITLGNGKGENWWCVLFPPLCFLESSDDTSDVEYQFFISSIINHFK